MKATLFSKLLATVIILSQVQAFAAKTTVSTIKDENVICFNVAKSDALVFKTTAPQKVWKAQQDREGKLKVKNALQLGQTELKQDSKNDLKNFKAEMTEGYQLSGSFDGQVDGDFPLTVTSTYLPEGNKSKVIDHYNCQSVKQ